MSFFAKPLPTFAGHALCGARRERNARGRVPFSRRQRGSNGAADEAAAENARLALCRVVENTRLPGRNALLGVHEIDLDAVGAPAQPCRLRRPRGAHLDEDFVPARAERVIDRAFAQPVDVAQPDPAGAQLVARPDHHAARRGIEPHYIERPPRRDAEPAPLADGEMDDAGMRAEHATLAVDDLARLGGAGLETLDDFAVAARGHKADVLAVALLRDRQTEPARKLPRLRLGHVAERKTQELELLARGGEQEIALVALRLARAIERPPPARQRPRSHVMAGRQNPGAELAHARKQI